MDIKYLATNKIFWIIMAGALLLAGIVVWYAAPKLFNGLPNYSFIPNQNNNSNQPKVAGIPKYLSIPSINVNATIDAAGLAVDGTVAVPKGPNGVNWYNLSSRPGEQGSAVITGHYGPWRTGQGSVFDNLHKMKVGDTVNIQDEHGNKFSFVVFDIKTYKSDEKVPEVFTKEDGKYLNLITCQGTWLQGQRTYTDRLVVFTKLVK
jgi:LPXTG-site transpeptidase (sortase) family protein